MRTHVHVHVSVMLICVLCVGGDQDHTLWHVSHRFGCCRWTCKHTHNHTCRAALGVWVCAVVCGQQHHANDGSHIMFMPLPSSQYGPAMKFPGCCGHEGIGVVTHIGTAVINTRIGARV